eukprot:TRINITY_DN30803_c0_g1_i1.p1 TRINITY_DN30803_c0_g1~~TRINITY_DN30803_c0_g1_i1.p1  ORF type:complete len:197 (+),score=68.36 TRINITY_DN30803_c0_g1_i1:49-591(+)
MAGRRTSDPGEPLPQGLSIAVEQPTTLRPSDQSEVMRLYRVAFLEENQHKEQQGLSTTNSMAEETAYSYIFGGKQMLVARAAGSSVVGFATLERTRSHECWLRCLVVDLDSRRHGVGKHLLRAAVKQARESYSRAMRLSYWEGRPRWLGLFYRSEGFIEDQYGPCGRRGRDYIDMTMPLR